MTLLANQVEKDQCRCGSALSEIFPEEECAAIRRARLMTLIGKTNSKSEANAGPVVENPRLRLSGVGFLTAIVILLVAIPFIQDLQHGQFYEVVLVTVVMCTGLMAIGCRRRLPLGLGSFALCAIWLNQLWPEQYPSLTFILPGLAFLVVVIASLLKFIVQAKQVDADVLCGGISAYLIFGFLWGLAYTWVAQLIPHAFSFNGARGGSSTMGGFTAMYFSFTTLATLGYGDITPTANVARMLAMLEAMTGTLFVAVMIAHLVSLYSASAQVVQQPETREKLPGRRAI